MSEPRSSAEGVAVAASLRASLAVAVPSAVAFGLVEAGWRLARGEVPIGGARLLSAAALLYGTLGGVAAIGLTLVHSLLRALSRPAPPTVERGDAAAALAWHLAAVGALAIAVALAYPLNRTVLADAFGAPSLIVNGLLLFVGVPLGARLLRPTAERLASALATSVGRRITFGCDVALALVAIAPCLASSSAPPRDHDSALDSPPRSSGERAARSNVLLLVIDTLRADRLGCYGASRPTSPRLDALAADALRFENCLAQAPHTKPSVASLLTGRLPPRHGVELFGAALSDSERPLAELLRDAGYRTGLFSANAFVAPTFGFAQGIDRYVGPMVSPAAPLAAFHVLARLRDAWVEALGLPERPWLLLEAFVSLPFDRSGRRNDPRAAELQQELLAFVDAAHAEQRSWFAHVQYMETHAPYRPAAAARALPGFEAARAHAELPPSAEHLFLPFRTAAPLPPADLAALVATYDACIRDVDASIGALLDGLEARGLLDETLVIVTSDHGEEFFDHGGFGHGHSLHRELLHVPLVLRLPERLPAGRVVPTQVRSVDLLPTLLELLDLELPAGAPPLDGASLLPLLRNEETTDRPAFSSVQWGGSSALAHRDGARTLLLARSGGEERRLVFDARLDPTEQHEIGASDPALAAAVEPTIAALERFAAEAAATADRPARAALDDATREQLRRLGYAGE